MKNVDINSNLASFKANTEQDINLTQQEKTRVILGISLVILFSSLTFTSMCYYNAPNHNPFIVFEGTHNYDTRMDIHHSNFPIYKLMSTIVKSNSISLEISLEQKGKETPITSTPLKTMTIQITFAKNRCRVQIQASNSYEIPLNILSDQDTEFSRIGYIEDLNDSNIGIEIEDHPFAWKLFRKEDNEIIFDSSHSEESKNFETYFYLSENYYQISTRLPKGHYTYGWAEQTNSEFWLGNGSYLFYHNPWKEDGNRNGVKNTFSTYPNFITVNPQSWTSSGISMFNSSPIEVVIQDEYWTYKISDGIVDMFIFSGPRTMDVIYQGQLTFGMPIIPKFSDLNLSWNIITKDFISDIEWVQKYYSDKSRKVLPIKELWVDNVNESDDDIGMYKKYGSVFHEMGIGLNYYFKSGINTEGNVYKTYTNTNNEGDNICVREQTKEIVSNNNEGERTNNNCIANYFNQSAKDFREYQYKETYLTETKLLLDMNEAVVVLSSLERDRIGTAAFPWLKRTKLTSIPSTNHVSKNAFNSDVSPVYESVLEINSNIYSLVESQTFYSIISQSSPRPLLFTSSLFTGSQQYTGVWLGHLSPTWNDLKYAIKQTLVFNLMGNPNVISETYGYHVFSGSDQVSQAIDKELLVRWFQFTALNIHARTSVNPFYDHTLNTDNKESTFYSGIEKSLKLRQSLSWYMYTNIIKTKLQGGGFILPVFAYCSHLTLPLIKEFIFTSTEEFMLGANIWVAPVIKPNIKEKAIAFPNEKFYDFYTGELMNPDGEGFKTIPTSLSSTPLFLRGGFITPIQEVEDEIIEDLNEMRKKSIQLIIAWDSDNHSQGKLITDDGIVGYNDNNLNYYRMDFVASGNQESNELDIILKVTSDAYKWNGIYDMISSVKWYGWEEKPKRIIVEKTVNIHSNWETIELGYDSINFISKFKVLEIDLQDVDLLLNLPKGNKYKIRWIN